MDSGLPANIQLDIDGDRETERIYSLFNLYMGKLEKMQGECGPWAPTVGGCELGRVTSELLLLSLWGPWCPRASVTSDRELGEVKE